MNREPNCVDIVTPFVDLLDACRMSLPDIQLFGGIGSAALGNTKTVILPDDKRIIAPADLYVPQHREDGNLRDLDCLVLSSDEFEVEEIEALAKDIIGDDLEISIFGLRPMAQLEWQRRHPLLAFAKVHVSDRYVEQDGRGVITRAQKALLPFAVDLPVDTLETWQLQIGNDEDILFPVPHPGATVLNYLGRSISGTRPKDIAKLHKLTRNIVNQWPDLTEWIADGSGASQLTLARILHTLREPLDNARTLYVGGVIPVEPYSYEELVQHDAFMLSPETQVGRQVLAAAKVEASILFMLERRPQIVTAWQKHVEAHTQAIVKNR